MLVWENNRFKIGNDTFTFTKNLGKVEAAFMPEAGQYQQRRGNVSLLGLA